jgi:hypothetical protein
MPNTQPSRARCIARVACALAACSFLASAPALAAPLVPASPLSPRLLFGLAILGPLLVPVAAYAAGFIADLLQRSKDV